MRMNEITFEGQPPVDGYGPGGFRLGGVWYDGSLIVLPDSVQSFDGGIDDETMSPVFAAMTTLDVVLVGMGGDIAPLPGKIRDRFDAEGVGVEVMSTASACRTYNVLLTEDRRVALVALAV